MLKPISCAIYVVSNNDILFLPAAASALILPSVFIKRNRTRLAGKHYESVLLVQGKRVPSKRPPGRPAAGAPAPKSVVIHETLANLSKLPPDLIALIDGHCKNQPSPPLASASPSAGTD